MSRSRSKLSPLPEMASNEDCRAQVRAADVCGAGHLALGCAAISDVTGQVVPAMIGVASLANGKWHVPHDRSIPPDSILRCIQGWAHVRHERPVLNPTVEKAISGNELRLDRGAKFACTPAPGRTTLWARGSCWKFVADGEVIRSAAAARTPPVNVSVRGRRRAGFHRSTLEGRAHPAGVRGGRSPRAPRADRRSSPCLREVEVAQQSGPKSFSKACARAAPHSPFGRSLPAKKRSTGGSSQNSSPPIMWRCL